MTRRVSAASLALLLLSGCFRTVYRNLQPPNSPPVVESAVTLDKMPRSAWQSFFFYGWFPTERPIDAAKQCGGEAHVATIETEQSFGQGVIAFAVMLGFYLGIYSPWSAHVTCDHTAPRG